MVIDTLSPTYEYFYVLSHELDIPRELPTYLLENAIFKLFVWSICEMKRAKKLHKARGEALEHKASLSDDRRGLIIS